MRANQHIAPSHGREGLLRYLLSVVQTLQVIVALLEALARFACVGHALKSSQNKKTKSGHKVGVSSIFWNGTSPTNVVGPIPA